jgi:hypothetical protein
MTFCAGKSRAGKSPRLGPAINRSQSIALGKRAAEDLDAPPSKKPRQDNAECLVNLALVGSISKFLQSLGTQMITSSGKLTLSKNTKNELVQMTKYLECAAVQIKKFSDILLVEEEEKGCE